MTSPDGELRRLALGVLLPGFSGSSPPGWLLDRVADGLAGVVLFARNVDAADPDEGVAALTAQLRTTRPDVLVGIDEEGGDVTRLDHALGARVPGPAALGRVDDLTLSRRVAQATGVRLARAGVRLVLAPVADVHADPDNPVIGIRSFGPDPQLVARHVAATVAGLHDAGVAATAKHFPGHGATRDDSHLTAPVLDADLDLLRRRELVPFRAAVAAGVDVVMTAHVRYPALDPAVATLSHRVVTDLLRGELGFSGVVMSDGLDMYAISGTVGRAEGAVQALAAGVDALCLGGESLDLAHVDGLAAAIAAAVRDGRLPQQRLAEAAGRVVALAARLAALSDRAGADSPGPDSPGPDDPGREAARRAIEVSGSVVLTGPPLVAELVDAGSIPAGDVPWGVGAAVAAKVPGTRVRRVDAATSSDPAAVAAALVAEAGTGPLVLSARHTRRGCWPRAVIDAVAAARPDLVLVDHGLPAPDLVVARVATWSASRVSAEAAADVLAGVQRWLPSSP
jgi:beta-N-acetylhexosaminidase